MHENASILCLKRWRWGASMGTRIITPGSGSMKMPTPAATFTATKNITGDSQLTMSCDRYRNALHRQHPRKAAEVAMTSSTEDVSMARRA